MLIHSFLDLSDTANGETDKPKQYDANIITSLVGGNYSVNRLINFTEFKQPATAMQCLGLSGSSLMIFCWDTSRTVFAHSVRLFCLEKYVTLSIAALLRSPYLVNGILTAGLQAFALNSHCRCPSQTLLLFCDVNNATSSAPRATLPVLHSEYLSSHLLSINITWSRHYIRRDCRLVKYNGCVYA